MRYAVIRPAILISITLALIFLFVQILPAKAQQDPPPSTSELSKDGIERLLKDLEDPQRLSQIKQDLLTLLALQESSLMEEPEPEPKGLAGRLLFIMSEYMQEVTLVLNEAGGNLLQVPSFALDLVEQARDPEVLVSWMEMAGKVFLVLLAGFLAHWVAFRLLARTRRSLEGRQANNNAARFVLLAGCTLLEVIPIAAFAVVAYGLLPLLDPRTGTQLVALSLINAHVLVGVILALTRFALSPGAPSLRMPALDDESILYLYIWVRRVVRIGVYGFFILEAFLILGLSASLYLLFLKLLGLLITLMTIMLIMQNRAAVAARIRGDQVRPAAGEPPEPGREDSALTKIQMVSTLRRYLAEFWHIAAMVLVVGMFGTWALEIEGGLSFLARAVIMTALVLVLISFLIRLSQRGLDQLFKISDELKAGHPGLEARANRYMPLLRHTVRGVLYLIAAFSIMQVWGLGALSWLLSPQGLAIVSDLVIIVLIVAGTLLFWEVVNAKIEQHLAREREEMTQKKGNTRLLTLLPLFSNVIRIALVLVAGMSVLAHMGINIAPLLAGAGVIGLAIGFGAQTLVRDVITGAFILMEDSIAVGDWVEAGGYAGTVEHLTVRTLTLRDLSGTVYVIPFGDVTTVKNSNRDYGFALIDAGVAYREDYNEVVQLLQEVAAELQQDETWGPDIIGDLEIFGLNNLGDSAVEIRVRLKTRPMRQFSVRRAFLERMKRIFDENGIEIPFPHQTIWFGEGKDGSAPPMRLVKKQDEPLESPEAIEAGPEEAPEEPEVQYVSESEASSDVVREKEEVEETREQEERDKISQG